MRLWRKRTIMVDGTEVDHFICVCDIQLIKICVQSLDLHWIQNIIEPGRQLRRHIFRALLRTKQNEGSRGSYGDYRFPPRGKLFYIKEPCIFMCCCVPVHPALWTYVGPLQRHSEQIQAYLNKQHRTLSLFAGISSQTTDVSTLSKKVQKRMTLSNLDTPLAIQSSNITTWAF